jgi:hypothetical protein
MTKPFSNLLVLHPSSCVNKICTVKLLNLLQLVLHKPTASKEFEPEKFLS